MCIYYICIHTYLNLPVEKKISWELSQLLVAGNINHDLCFNWTRTKVLEAEAKHSQVLIGTKLKYPEKDWYSWYGFGIEFICTNLAKCILVHFSQFNATLSGSIF